MSSEPAAPARDPDPARDAEGLRPSPDLTAPAAVPSGAPASLEAPAPLHPGERLLRGRWGWLDFLIVGPVLAASIWYYVGTPIATWMILHRQVIQASAIRAAAAAEIVSGAEVRTGQVAIWIALLAPLPISWCTDPCYYFGGRRYGRVLIDFLCRTDPSWTRRVARGERIFARFSVWAVLLSPTLWLPGGVFYFLAGETRMPFWKFITLDGLGELLCIGEMVAIGYFIGKPAETFVNNLSDYSLWIILGVVALLLVLSARRGPRSRRAEPGAVV